MRLDGQGESQKHAADASRLDDGGYVLVALLIGIAVAAVWMAALLPAWKHQTIRERETELVFRGEQYARAILLYSQKMNGAMPSSFDDLVSQHVLRQKWKDPITNDDFLPKVGCAPIAAGGVPGAGAPVRGGGVGQPARSNAGPGPAGAPIQPGPAVQPGPAPGRSVGPVVPGQTGQTQTQPGRSATQAPGVGQPQGGGICGVQSKSNATSIRVYQGQTQYDLWPFDVNTARTQVFANIQKLAGGTGAMPGVGLPAGPGVAQPVGTGGRGAPGGRGPVGPGRGIGPGGMPPIQAPTTGPGRGR